MKKLLMFVLFASMIALSPMAASAADMVEGSVQGFQCVSQGKVCPVGSEDPMADVERVFVVLAKDNSYYFVPNVDRAVMARHINDRIKVSGVMNSKYNSITAEKIEKFMNGEWRVVWTPKMVGDILDELHITAPRPK
jgi:hypothetical protein